MTENEIYKMPLYDGSNWSGYRMRMSGYAGKKKLLKILDGTTSPAIINADQTTTNAEKLLLIEAYDTGNMDLYAKLVETIQDDGGIVDIKIGDGRAIWLYLLSVHESNSRASVKQLVRHLGELRQGSRTVKDFLAEVAVTRNRIDSALIVNGLAIIDVLHSMAQIQGLDPKYEMLKNHLFLDDTLTPAACKAKIIETTERMDMEQREPSHMSYLILHRLHRLYKKFALIATNLVISQIPVLLHIQKFPIPVVPLLGVLQLMKLLQNAWYHL
jgi:hypothetical protein